MTLITVALLIAPAIIISACYTVIVRTIWTKSKLLVPIGVTHHQLQQNQQASRRRQSREYYVFHLGIIGEHVSQEACKTERDLSG